MGGPDRLQSWQRRGLVNPDLPRNPMDIGGQHHTRWLKTHRTCYTSNKTSWTECVSTSLSSSHFLIGFCETSIALQESKWWRAMTPLIIFVLINLAFYLSCEIKPISLAEWPVIMYVPLDLSEPPPPFGNQICGAVVYIRPSQVTSSIIYRGTGTKVTNKMTHPKLMMRPPGALRQNIHC